MLQTINSRCGKQLSLFSLVDFKSKNIGSLLIKLYCAFGSNFHFLYAWHRSKQVAATVVYAVKLYA